MTKVISICNHKGGVGKTTSVANIGAALARKGHKTLLIDLDAQSNLTYSLMKEEQIEPNIYDALVKGQQLPIIHVKENLDLSPSGIEMARAEMDLSRMIAREQILKNIIAPVKADYDYILLDCPPSLGLIVTNALTASTDLYICLTAEALPLKGLSMLDQIVGEVQRYVNNELKLSGVIITRYNKRRLNNVVDEAVRAKYGNGIVFNTKIRENIAIAEAPLTGKDIFTYAPDSNGAADYEALTAEIIARDK